MKHKLTIIVSVWFILLSGCAGDPNQKANELFVKASEYAQNMHLEIESYSNAFDFYKNAQEQIERILSKYPASNIAVRLLSGEAQISGYTLSDFRKLGSSLQLFADAERELSSCALIFANTIENESFKAGALAVIAGNYASAGQNDKANQLLSEALETANTIKDQSLKDIVLLEIAGNYLNIAFRSEKN